MTGWICDIHFDLSAVTGQGITIAIIGYVIVFLALFLSAMLFSGLPRLLYHQHHREAKKLKKQNKKPVGEDIHISAEVTAAIATALHLYYNEIHDPESNIITIERVRKRYSPWSSKIYGLRRWPHQTF